jgi:hypothetical protein
MDQSKTIESLEARIRQLERMNGIEPETRRTQQQPNRPSTTSRYQEDLIGFITRHRGRPVKVGDRWLLQTGAFFRSDGYHLTVYEPSSDPKARIAVQQQYHRTKLAVAKTAFDHLKLALSGRGNPVEWNAAEFGPAPAVRDHRGLPCGKAALERLREIVYQHVNALTAHETELSSLPEVQNERQQAQSARMSESVCASRRDEAMAIEL